jgi:hypothetical protein
MVLEGMFNPRAHFRARRQIQDDLRELENMSSQKEFRDHPERMALLEKLSAILGFQAWLLEHPAAAIGYAQRRNPPDDLYFGGGYKTVDDRLDFALWKQLADKLNINLTDADLARAIKYEAAGHEDFDPDKVDFEKDEKIKEFLRGRRDIKPKDFAEALRDEFRVSMAQGILLGYEPGVRQYRSLFGTMGTPVAVTPDEFFNFYRQMRAAMNVKMLGVPAEKFLDKVKEKPSEDELRALFRMFQDKVDDPASRDPGFKEPRRVRIEYVSASPDDPFYREQARQQVKLLAGPLGKVLPWSNPFSRASATVGAGSLLPSGAGPLAHSFALLGAVAFDPLRQEYDKYREDEEKYPWISSSSDELFELIQRSRKLHMTSVLRPANLASTIGTASGSVAGLGSPFAGLSTLYATSTLEEVRGSLRQNTTVLLSSSDPQQLFGTAALALVLQPKILSVRQMRPVLIAEMEKSIAENLVRGNLETVRAELQKLPADSTRAEKARKYLARAVKEFHLQRHEMPEALSRQEMIARLQRKEDIGIKPLLDAEPRAQIRGFVGRVFGEQGMGGPERQGVYDPEPVLEGTPAQRRDFLFWRSEDHPARKRSFAEARSDVEQAWKMERASELARQEADRLEAKINKDRLSPEKAAQFLGKQTWLGQPFELDGIAQLLPGIGEDVGEYLEYRVPEDRLKDIPYPPTDLARQLQALERPGEAMVIADQPARTFYVTVLVDRQKLTVQEFRKVYADTPRFDPLYTIFVVRQMGEYRRAVLEQLRREATGNKLDKQGRYEVPEDMRKRDSSRTQESEE